MDRSKPKTNGFVTTSRGNRVKVDELDMAVLNIGHGNNPMTNAHLDNGRGNFRRPIYNVEPGLSSTPTSVGNDPHAKQVFGDANKPHTIARSTGIDQFDQVHAINPYAYDPVTTGGALLASGGTMVVTGTARNKFADPQHSGQTVQANIGQPEKLHVPRVPHQAVGLTDPQSTTAGTMDPVHAKFPHALSSGRSLNTQTSQSHTYRKIPPPHVDVTPTLDSETRRNTIRNSLPVPTASPDVQRVATHRGGNSSSSSARKRVTFKL